MSGFWTTFTEFWSIVGAILSREGNTIVDIYNHQEALHVSLTIVLLAGLSESIGQSVTLFANEVKPRRFIISLMIGAVLFAGGFLMWVTSIYLIALAVVQENFHYMNIVRAVGLGYAPLLLGFLSLIPYFGNGISNLLYFWAFTAIVIGVHAALDVTVTFATLISGAGLLVIFPLRATFGRPLVRWVRRLRNVAAGTRLVLQVQKAVEQRFDIELTDQEDRADV